VTGSDYGITGVEFAFTCIAVIHVRLFQYLISLLTASLYTNVKFEPEERKLGMTIYRKIDSDLGGQCDTIRYIDVEPIYRLTIIEFETSLQYNTIDFSSSAIGGRLW